MDTDQNESSLTGSTMGKSSTATYDPILLQSVGYLINWYRTRMKQTRRLSVERHDLINKGANKNEA